MSNPVAKTDIAIIGMAGRFPGAENIDRFWQNLRDGVESIRFLSDQELSAQGVDSATLHDPQFVKAVATFDDIELFDAAFFGFNPREAEITDPQHRILLECAWEALEHAGYDPGAFDGEIGVYAGAAVNTYLLFNISANPKVMNLVDQTRLNIGNAGDFLATRISYKLNLKGPSVTVQTACSTSLVAVHLACQSLLDHECDMALAGGVSVNVRHRSGYYYQPDGIVSPDGHCRAFDAQAQGTVFGSGVGLVVLKRLADARTAGDTIYAVIKGSAINNDGALKVGYTAPSVEGQVMVIEEAQAIAGVRPDTISYIEAHGTGTPLGDPVELTALTRVFQDHAPHAACAIGSVKPNIGHLDAAAGIASLIKTVLALTHRQLPPSLHCAQPTPQIDWSASPFQLVTRATSWPAATGSPRRAGVSSFGIGGTNAHLVLEEPPPAHPSSPARPTQLLLLSAKSPAALHAASAALATRLTQPPALALADLADLAYTLQAGRHAFAHRRVLLCHDHAEALAGLTAPPAPHTIACCPATPAPLAFLFPGQGAQYRGMAAQLAAAEPHFRAQLDHGLARLAPALAQHLRPLLTQPATAALDAEQPDPLAQTALAQPALFLVEYALAQLLLSWGVRPQALLGHSLGEYVAATLAGVFTLDDALALVCQRGQLMQALPPGAMLAVALSEAALVPLLPARLDLAAVNSPQQCVVAGADADVAAFADELRARGVNCQRLASTQAFHSAQMAGLVAPFAAAVAQVARQPPQLPLVSSMRGRWLTADEATDPHYWAAQLRAPVRFADGLQTAIQGRPAILLEVGPGHALGMLAKTAPAHPELTVLDCLRHRREPGNDIDKLLTTVGQLWLAGVPIAWRALHGSTPRRVPLPTYPFERQRYWITSSREAQSALAGSRATPADWCFLSTWKRAPLPSAASLEPQRWLILNDTYGVGEALTRRLVQLGHEVILANMGAAFAQRPHGFDLNPHHADDYPALLDVLDATARYPDHIVYLWGIGPACIEAHGESAQAGRPLIEASLGHLLQALAGRAGQRTTQLEIVGTNLVAVTDQERADPLRAAALGLCRPLAQLTPHLACRCIDIGGAPVELREAQALDQLLAEWRVSGSGQIVAYRGRQRWVPAFEPLPLKAASGLRSQGVYLLAGVPGESALSLAHALTLEHHARLALAFSIALPARPHWQDWLSTHPADDPVSRVLSQVKLWEAQGTEMLLLCRTYAGAGCFDEPIAQTIQRFGVVHGLIYDPALSSAPRPSHELVAAMSALRQSLASYTLDFCLVCGSTAALLGELGPPAAAAAHALGAAVAIPDAATPWLLIHWDAWQVEQPDQAEPSALTPAAGLQVVERAFALAGADALVIAVGGLSDRGRRTLPSDRSPEQPSLAEPSAMLHARPALSSAYVAPGTELEQHMTNIWQELLGIQPIGIHDNFFELGGHSLLATQVISRVRQIAQLDLPLDSLFDAPTVAQFTARMTAAQAIPERATPPILPVPRDQHLPLSFAQQRLLFMDQLAPGNPFYNIPCAVRISGRLNRAALARSLREIVRRHEVLRTTFSFEADQPYQVIAPALPINLVMIDISRLLPDERAEQAQQLMLAESQRPFDLMQGPVFRMLLAHLAADEHLLLLTLHHVVCDAWSFGVLLHELSTLYACFAGGAAGEGPIDQLALPPLPIQYADFAIWQRGWLQGAVLDRQITYWRRQLAGLPTLELPTDRPRPATQMFQGAQLHRTLPQHVQQELFALAQSAGATLFMVLLAGWQVLLHGLTGQDDIVVGTDVANRTQGETEHLIGFFVNQLVLRGNLAGDPSFREVLAQTRQMALDAYAHQDLPFDRLVELLRPARDLSRTPLFQVKIVLHNTPATATTIPGLRLHPINIDNQTAKFDLLLNLSESADGLHATAEYSTDLFNASTIARLLDRYTRLLQRVVAQQNLRLSELKVWLAAQEHDQQMHQHEQRRAHRHQKLKQIRRKEFAPVGTIDEEASA
jgi:acyl transferase domain-containing protein